MSPPARRWLQPLLAACFLLVFVWQALDHVDSGVAEKDSRTYLTIAYNMVRHGSYSSDTEGTRSDFTPTAVKPPGYPILLAAGIWLSPALSAAPQERLFEQEAQGLLWIPKLLQFGCLLAAAACAASIVRGLTGNRVLSWCALALVGLDPTLHRFAGRFNSENLGLLLITVASLCLMRIVQAPAPRKFALAGAVFAALALTRAIYYHFWVVAAILFLCRAYARPDRRRSFLAGTLIFMACYFPPVWGWMARNHHHFDRFYLSEGGGVVLEIRSQLDLMTREEYMASLLYFSNSGFLLEKVLPKLFAEEAYLRLDPAAETGIQQTARARREQLKLELGSRALADKALLHEAGWRILGHPVRHFLVSLPLGLRGIYVKDGPALSFILMGGLLIAFAAAARARDVTAVAVFLLATTSYAVHSGITHNIPRYNALLIPILWCALLSLAARAGVDRASREEPGIAQ